MLLSVIIPTCNRVDFLEQCLICLLKNNQVNSAWFNYEIIVSDDSSGNESKQLIEEKFPEVRWVRGPRKGPASNRNNGTKQAIADWLVFTDDDCLPGETWLNSYAEAIDRFKSEKVFEGYTNADRPQTRFDEEAPVNTRGGLLWSCNFCIRNDFFVALGGFDENFPFPAMEDSDLQRRILLITTIKFVVEAKIIHPWRIMEPFATYKKRAASLKFFAKKWGEYGTLKYRITRVKIFLGDIIAFSKELFRYSFRGWKFYFEKLLLDFVLIFT